jgi:hypothetical protein
MSDERRIGVFHRKLTPLLRLPMTTETFVLSSLCVRGTLTNSTTRNENPKVSASKKNGRWMSTLDRKPARAKPTAVEPNELIDRNEFAEASSSSDAISGMMLSQAGSKNCRTIAAKNRIT